MLQTSGSLGDGQGNGDITIIMFDGWDAPWSRITYDEVPFHEIYELVKRLQPNCADSVCAIAAAFPFTVVALC